MINFYKENYSNGLFWESPYLGGSIPDSSQPQTDCNGDGQWQGVAYCNVTSPLTHGVKHETRKWKQVL